MTPMCCRIAECLVTVPVPHLWETMLRTDFLLNRLVYVVKEQLRCRAQERPENKVAFYFQAVLKGAIYDICFAVILFGDGPHPVVGMPLDAHVTSLSLHVSVHTFTTKTSVRMDRRHQHASGHIP